MGQHTTHRAITGCTAVVIAAVLGARCAKTPTTATPTLTSISVTGLQGYSRLGLKAQYQATATWSDNSRLDVTSRSVWVSSDPSRLSVTTAGLSTYLAGNGTVAVTATYLGVVGTEFVTLSSVSEDCIAYTPSAIVATALGDAFAVTDGQQIYATLDTMADAASTVTLMQAYSSVCYVGRNNGRTDRLAYIVQYWKPAGPPPVLSPLDCISYNNANLTVNGTVAGFGLADGSTLIAQLDTAPDADLARMVALQYSAHCFIGRGNTRPNPLSYVVQYWK